MRRITSIASALFVAAVAAVAIGGKANAQGFSVQIAVDENGNGTFANSAGFSATLKSGLQNDIGPGGLSNVLTYDLLNPPGLVAGDVLINEPGTVGLGDVVRFNLDETGPGGGRGVLVFYSNPIDGFDSLGDTPSAPGAFYPNEVTLTEDASGSVFYTPVAGEPGFVAGAGGPVTYQFISDVPEPASLAVLGAGIAALGLARRRARA